MEKKFDITAMGELLIDFAPAGKSDTGMKLFEQNPGGAPANMLAAAKMVGLNVAFMGKVGADMHGIYLESVREWAGIDTRALVIDEGYVTTRMEREDFHLQENQVQIPCLMWETLTRTY